MPAKILSAKDIVPIKGPTGHIDKTLDKKFQAMTDDYQYSPEFASKSAAKNWLVKRGFVVEEKVDFFTGRKKSPGSFMGTAISLHPVELPPSGKLEVIEGTIERTKGSPGVITAIVASTGDRDLFTGPDAPYDALNWLFKSQKRSEKWLREATPEQIKQQKSLDDLKRSRTKNVEMR